jgi:hypothetical protein
MLEEFVRGAGRDLLGLVEFYALFLAVAIASLPLLAAIGRIRRHFWPPREDPEKSAGRAAWESIKAAAEERAYERVHDPHVMKLPRAPSDEQHGGGGPS